MLASRKALGTLVRIQFSASSLEDILLGASQVRFRMMCPTLHRRTIEHENDPIFLKTFIQLCGSNILVSYLTLKFRRPHPSLPVEVFLCTVDAHTTSRPLPPARRRFLPPRPPRWRVSACSLARTAWTWRLQLGSRYVTPPPLRSNTSYPLPGLALRETGNWVRA